MPFPSGPELQELREPALPSLLEADGGGVEARFDGRADGVLDVDLGPQWSGFTEALQDAVTTRAPRGSDGVNPSTYWIDRLVAALSGAKDNDVVASGNSTDLVVRAADVVARSQYDTFDDERLSRSDLLDVLAQWRAEVGRTRPTDLR